MLVKTIYTGDQLQKEFENFGRWGQFTPTAFDALADYFSEFEEKIELDVVAICCDFSEYTEDELVREYDSYGETAEEIAEAIADETWVIELKNGNYLLQIF